MNPTKIEWCDFTWNPVTGCLHGCSYCYARGVARRFGKDETERAFQPKFHADRLMRPMSRRTPTRVFVGSMCDLFGRWVPQLWIEEVLSVCAAVPRHTFIFLTKNPLRLLLPDFPDNCWVGVSTPTQTAYDQAVWLLPVVRASVKFVSAEPLQERIHLASPSQFWVPDWLIIGAQTGPGAPEPLRGPAHEMTLEAQVYGVPCFVKDNMGFGRDLREFPPTGGFER